ncbi:MAG TPA: HD domain-containing protein [Nannocystis sp.]
MLLRDPVHGLISFSGEAARLVMRLLDCAEVQRLRRIRALGLASLAFPGGEHSRFAHALGSAHVMQRYLDRVRTLAEELPPHDRIDDHWALIALAAALLHDLGHGPLSHTFEAVLPGAPRHEVWTSRILLDPDTEVHAVLAELDPSVPALVERLIFGQGPIGHLARAVSGTFDVDRCDYLMRDSYMTGVRYGLLDVDWLLASLRLYVPAGSTSARLAVDGEKGLTAVEGFFLARLYMYRQVYLHKAARAAEMMIRALFRRLCDTDPDPGTPPVLEALLRGRDVSVRNYLTLDDHTLAAALAAYADSPDPVLRELAQGIVRRRLFKTLRLGPEADSARAEARLREILAAEGFDPVYLGAIDRVEIDAYTEDEALMVLRSGGRVQRLLDASPLLRGLARERFVHHRAVFPAAVRARVGQELSDMT